MEIVVNGLSPILGEGQMPVGYLEMSLLQFSNHTISPFSGLMFKKHLH